MTDRALLIGIDEYPDPLNNLNSCVADTVAFTHLLRRLDFDESGIRVLHNSDATLAATRDGLDWLMDGAQEGDRLVFFQSSHGYRYLKGDVMTEVLCAYDEFLEDTELADRTALLPSGVLTVVLDSCHSGGMEKALFRMGLPQSVRAKVFIPPREKLMERAKSVGLAHALKPFGRTALRNEASLARNMAHVPNKAPMTKGAITGANELNGVLLTACQADQTAAAGSEATDWLSAFTYALTAEMDPSISISTLRDRSVARIADLNMSQTPCVFAPSDHPYLLTETFISRQQTKSKEMIHQVEEMLKEVAYAGGAQKAFAHGTGEGVSTESHTWEVKGMSTVELEKSVDAATEKIFAGVKAAGKGKSAFGFTTDVSYGLDTQTVAAVLAPAMAAAIPTDSKSYAVRQPVSDTDNLLDKGFWDSAARLARVVVPAVLDELTKSGSPRKGYSKAADPADVHREISKAVPSARMGDPKFFGLVETLIGIAAPIIIDAVTKDFKHNGRPAVGKIDVELPAGLSESEKKNFWDDALDVVGTALPYVIRAIA
ncbi:caspase family protein [Streptomyces sp. NBC_00878]|uniref:caspase family protein n=1 Tax=Streptomyces sp. NBC_00878 TaxID=2975854 RepID=UPI00225509F6|nr:caspase family protein [Streptomyces sp. NBC_00878]MCX4907297.1 caspase family protein [Streptomyces sp. NBC_00878]